MYTLYTGDNCHQCAHVESYLQKQAISFRKVNVDQMEEEPPIQTFAFPALFLETELIGYGTDIITFFQKKSQTV